MMKSPRQPVADPVAPARHRPDENPELPVWKKRLSFRGQPYRYGEHQNGVMGYLRVRLVAVADLAGSDWSLLKGGSKDELCPYVSVGLGKVHVRSSPRVAEYASGGMPVRASWKKEILSVEVLKGTLPPGEPMVLDVQVYNHDAGMVQSMIQTAVRSVTGSGGSLLGVGDLEVSGLFLGTCHLVDTWVELQPRGRCHVHVEYEPKGVEPRPNDVIYLESFARWGGSVVLPPGEAMVVHDVKGQSLLVGFDCDSSIKDQQRVQEGRIRLHRNCAFVVERLNWVDMALVTSARPLDAMLRTDVGSWTVRKLRPLFEAACVLAAPMFASLHIALTTGRIALKTALAGTSAVVSDSLRG